MAQTCIETHSNPIMWKIYLWINKDEPGCTYGNPLMWDIFIPQTL